MMTLMHEATPYGHLLINGKAPSVSELAGQVGRPVREVRAAVEELKANNVYSVTDAGVVFSRRMCRTAERSAIGRVNGSKGGNPALLDKGSVAALDNQTVESTPEARCQIPQPPEGGERIVVGDPDVGQIAAGFLEDYPSVYSECRDGAYYHVPQAKYWPVALELAAAYPDRQRLGNMLRIFLKRTDIGPKNTPGTPGQFRHMAPDCDRLLKANGR